VPSLFYSCLRSTRVFGKTQLGGIHCFRISIITCHDVFVSCNPEHKHVSGDTGILIRLHSVLAKKTQAIWLTFTPWTKEMANRRQLATAAYRIRMGSLREVG